LKPLGPLGPACAVDFAAFALAFCAIVVVVVAA
jgi:hypothetical protein